MYTVIYASGNINTSVNGSLEDIKTAMRSRFPELANVEPTVNDNVITFTVDNGRKASSYTVIYASGNINTVVNGSLEDIKTAMKNRFPELSNVEPTVNGSIITFVVDNGRKASSLIN